MGRECGEMKRKKLREQAESLGAGFALARDNEQLEAELANYKAFVDELKSDIDVAWSGTMGVSHLKALLTKHNLGGDDG